MLARAATVSVLALLSLAGAAQALDQVTFGTNWKAQAEHGGFYQAVATGIYEKHGLDVTIRPGGPQVNHAQLLAAGQIDFNMGGSMFGQFNFTDNDIPMVTVAAIFQKDPQILMAHAGVGHDGFEALRGKPILISGGGRVTFWPFLRARFGYSDDQIRPYTFNLQPFIADRNAVQQAYVTSEPFAVRRAGVNPVILLLADVGYEYYSTTIDAGRATVEQKADLAQRFVNATIEGWNGYLQGDTAAANALIKRDNPDMDDDKLAYATNAMQEFGIVQSGDALALGTGAMTDDRWQRCYDLSVRLGINPAGMDFKKGYSLRFVNQRVGVRG
jgi:NitT/TauT family transport system substrate-binding protein